MQDEEYQLNYSSHSDVSQVEIEDYIPNALTKVYPYRSRKANVSNEAFVSPDTITMISISQDNITDFINLQQDYDENDSPVGDKYFKIFKIVDIETGATIASGTDDLKKAIRKVKTFTAITNNYFDSDDDKPDFFVMGEPFDEEKFKNGELFIYYGENFVPSGKEEFQFYAGYEEYSLDDTPGLASLRMQEVSVLEESIKNSKLNFTLKNIDVDNIRDIKVEVPPNIIIDSFKAKGITKGNDSELIDIDFTTKSDLNWFNVTPVGIKDKLTLSPSWFDNNIVIEKHIADYILSQGEITWTNFCTHFNIDSDLRNLVLNVLLYSFEFQTGFSHAKRNERGAIIENYVIGTKDRQVSSIANQNPVSAIDGLYREWRKLSPSKVDTDQDKIVKGILNAISQEIISSLATANGENNFNKAILPWRIKLSRELQVTLDETAQGERKRILLNDFSFTMDESPYFKKETDKFVRLDEISLSERKVVKSDRDVTMPELPDQMEEQDKTSAPGDVSTSSNNDLKYMVKLPLYDDEMDKLFSGTGQAGGTQTITIKNADLSRRLNAWETSEADTEIRKKIIALYPDAKNITVVNPGRSKTSLPSLNWRMAGYSSYVDGNIINTSYLPVHDGSFIHFLTTPWEINREKKYDVTTINDDVRNYKENSPYPLIETKWWRARVPHGAISSNYVDVKDDEAKAYFKQLIAYYYGIKDQDNITIDKFEMWNNRSRFEYDFSIKRHEFVDYEYTFETDFANSSLVSRQTTYDRAKWKQLIKSIINPANGLTRTIELEEKWGTGEYRLKEFTISTLFGDKITLELKNGQKIEIKLFQRDEETSTTQTINFY